MVRTDRRIIVSNGRTSIELTRKPYYVNETEGFDRLDIRIISSQGYDQDGGEVVNSYAESRELRIKGQIKASSTQQMQILQDNLSNIFIPNTPLKINHYYGGANRSMTVRVKRTPSYKRSDVSKIVSYEVTLQSESEVYWSDPTESLVQIANMTGGFHFPLVIDKNKGVSFGIKSALLIADVYNSSQISIGMRIEFIANGTVTNPQLFDVNTRKYIKILCVMEPGDKITIETGKRKTVTRKHTGIEEDYMGRIDIAGGGSSFLTLAPGDNLLRYAADDGEDMLETKIYYNNLYVRA